MSNESKVDISWKSEGAVLKGMVGSVRVAYIANNYTRPKGNTKDAYKAVLLLPDGVGHTKVEYSYNFV